jgi:hypothetical protein
MRSQGTRYAAGLAIAPRRMRYSCTLMENVLRSCLSVIMTYVSASCEDMEKETVSACRAFASTLPQTIVPVALRVPLSYKSTWYVKSASTALVGFTDTTSESESVLTMTRSSVAIGVVLLVQMLKPRLAVEATMTSAITDAILSALSTAAPLSSGLASIPLP